MSDRRSDMSGERTDMHDHKSDMSSDKSDMNEFDIDQQLAQWQSAYKAATPKVDTASLIKETKSARTKLKLKGLVDLVLGIAVSLWCVVIVLSKPLTTNQLILFCAIAPIPIAFGVWGYWVRQKQWKAQTLDVQSMLSFKQNQLQQQVHYWKVSFYGCAVIWLGLLTLAAFNMLMFQTYTLWGTQLLVNSIVVAVVYRRYKKLKADLPEALANIDLLK